MSKWSKQQSRINQSNLERLQVEGNRREVKRTDAGFIWTQAGWVDKNTWLGRGMSKSKETRAAEEIILRQRYIDHYAQFLPPGVPQNKAWIRKVERLKLKVEKVCQRRHRKSVERSHRSARRIARRLPRQPSYSPRYLAYIQSPEWRAKRKEVFRLRGAKCEACPAVRMLQLHHLTYQRLGHELPEDLQILCKPCHEKRHGRKFDAL